MNQKELEEKIIENYRGPRKHDDSCLCPVVHQS